jgi:hypothetical protein
MPRFTELGIAFESGVSRLDLFHRRNNVETIVLLSREKSREIDRVF